MARIVPVAMIVAMAASPALGQPAGPSDSGNRSAQLQAFDISDEATAITPASSGGSRIIAGTEVAPNAMIGFGMFGFKGEKSMHSPVTARDLSTARPRKAAVGFSLRF